uniref:Lymphocyte-specific protein 1 n=1 Tax=Accipiter nisus TaxID=211598 RepID=A0A8B9RR71_9AVES
MSDSEGCQKGAEGVNQVGDESPGDSERLTAQWSVEDEEEAARERRRREREKQLRSQAEEGLNSTVSCSESVGPAQENHYDFKPSGTSELEEDEGFSDWSQKLEQRKQRSPRQSYEEEDGGVKEAEVKLEQIQLDQESPEEVQDENVVIGEEERLCQEEEQVQDQEEEERAEQEVGSEGADHLLFPGLVAVGVTAGSLCPLARVVCLWWFSRVPAILRRKVLPFLLWFCGQ